ncbi:MAG TPA: 50S ribosomal protein L24 [Acidobacterium sp.]|uniref:Large ribosomal subunit protein uL24 n=1 Tax=Acidobacterium capsulatum (strain ATCC 51196 / DSM 11244 / BCRC 80197 / JCM 7670 / NBRC 15755 / NCIMB 13165 / 161) TaxID=240015 RepID=C1F631_ACIC5|nr:ribosomal protein L24 [Acidobacterium capsulatum ATCC 51196]HCT60392.1 50S ribosomal protein L24 [Acidobacterium sp.]
MPSLNIRRNDQVEVIAGSDKGKRGRVLRVLPGASRVLVEHVRVVKKHVRPNPQRNIKGGIAEQEMPINISNVMLVCPNCGPTRVGHKLEGDHKVRVCKKCGQTLAGKK